ncbi:MAG: branched-chain amino acid transaminase [Deltaproteobacteria bacterium]|nr:branched-chain amino acid transaminase [Deltaproteobacteria bacterium]
MQKVSKIWLDGKMVGWDEANVHILTHTLHYGLGVFEGIRAYQCSDGSSAIFRLKEHIDRLYNSAHILQMKIPFEKEVIIKACKEIFKVNKLAHGYLRPLAFIGDGEMGIYAASNPIRVALAAWAWGSYLGDEGVKNGIRAKISSFTRHHVNSIMNKAKSVAVYTNSVLAKREVLKAGYEEAILLDSEGYVAEASGENIFVVKNGIVKTTPSGASILDGITANSIVTILKDKKVEVVFQKMTRDELYLADEIFLTGTAAEVTPVRELDDRTIGTGKPGPITQEIQKTFFGLVKGDVKEYRHWLETI